MKNIFILCCIFFIVIRLIAQPTFEKTFGTIDDDMGYSVSICNDNSYIICGYTANLYTGDEDIFTAKINIYGDTIWTRKEGTEYNYDIGYSVKQTNDNGYIVTGSTSGSPFLLKYNMFGIKEWFIDYSTTFSSGNGYSVLQTTDSGYVFCGISDYYDSENTLWNRKACLLRTDKYGEYLWDNTFGNYGIHYAFDLCFSNDNGFVVCGEFDTPDEYTDAWLFKTNENGNLNWNKTYGGESSIEYAMKVKKTSDGGYIFCGTMFYGLIPMYGDVYLVKTDENGNEEWNQTFGTSGDDRGRCIDITNDGGYIICGNTDSFGAGGDDIWMIRTNSEGDTLWTRTYGGIYNEYALEVCETYDGGFIVCGSTQSFGNGGSDIYLFKTNWYGTLTDIADNMGEMEKTTVAPNPTNGIFFIKNCPASCEYEIYGSNGNTLLKGKQNEPGLAEIDITEFPTGTYILKLKTTDGIKSFKLIKK